MTERIEFPSTKAKSSVLRIATLIYIAVFVYGMSQQGTSVPDTEESDDDAEAPEAALSGLPLTALSEFGYF